MLKNRSFTAKTRGGKVVRVVKEHYLRDDIYCAVEDCTACAQSETRLSANPRKTTLVPAPHYLVPDTNVLYQQMDLLCNDTFKDVIVLQTVAQELKNRSAATYTKVRARLEDPEMRWYLFSNEHHRGTYVERAAHETPNDRNDRAIRVAAEWYARHVAPLGGDAGRTAVLLSDDADCRRRAVSEHQGLTAVSTDAYVAGMPDHPELAELVAGRAAHEAQKAREREAADEVAHAEYLTPAQIQLGLRAGRLLQGALSVSSYNSRQGSVFAEVGGAMQAVKICGRAHLNRGVHGDQVAVELLPEAEWQSAAAAETAVGDDSGDEAEKAPEPAQDPLRAPTGRIVGVIKRNWRPYCGCIDPRTVSAAVADGNFQNVLFVALDARVPRIRIRTRQAHALKGTRIVVAIDRWDRGARRPAGHFVRALGDAGDRGTETEVLLLEHDVPNQPFSKQVLSSLPAEGDAWVVTDAHREGRRDLRGELVCSIDPPGCTDIDDALHARLLPNGNVAVGVHIADVTHFVKTDSAMDVEAARRGTTVYLVDQRIDMLPPLLGTNLCSLRCNVERLAFSVLWELTPDGDTVHVEFTKSVIRSHASLTYAEAQARIDDATRQDDLTRGIRLLNGIAKRLRARRMAAGALTLASPEVRFHLENESQDPVDLELKQLQETNALVEEFMLLANIAVAQRIYQSFPESAMLRRHPAPPQTSFAPLLRALEPFGIELDTSSSRALADSLDAAERTPKCLKDPYFGTLLRILTTRCMMQAVYFGAGQVSYGDYWHYGLATPIYTHFTSPIRRYCDVIVHRQLAAAIGAASGGPGALTNGDSMAVLCDNLNLRNRMAQLAGRASVELYTHLYFRGRVLEEPAHVVRVLRNGLVVLVPKFGVEALVAAPDEHFGYDARENCLVATRAPSVRLGLFARVTVRLSVADVSVVPGLKQRLVMELVEPVVPGFSVPAGGDSASGHSASGDSASGDSAGSLPSSSLKRKQANV